MPKRHRNAGLARLERNWGIILAMPTILGFLIFTIGPMIASFTIGLTDWNVGSSPHFVGLHNYKAMFSGADPLFLTSLAETVEYAFGGIVLLLIVAFAVALLLNQNVRGLRIFRTIYYLPVVVPFVSSSILWLWLFNPNTGLLNTALKAVGLPPSQWIYSEKSVIPSLILMNAWTFGNAALIFLAGLQGVPRHLYEALAVDGGNVWHKFRYVTIPMMTPTIFFNLVIGLIFSLQEFVRPYIMTQGGPGNSSLLYVYYIWRTAFQDGQLGYASALSWVLFAVILIVAAVIFRTARHWVYYEVSVGR